MATDADAVPRARCVRCGCAAHPGEVCPSGYRLGYVLTAVEYAVVRDFDERSRAELREALKYVRAVAP